jgi:hypothetical protein
MLAWKSFLCVTRQAATLGSHICFYSLLHTTTWGVGVAQMMSTEARGGHAQLHAPAVLRHGATVLRTYTKILDTGSMSYGGCFLGSFEVKSKTLHLFKSLTILKREQTYLNCFSFCHWACSLILYIYSNFIRKGNWILFRRDFSIQFVIFCVSPTQKRWQMFRWNMLPPP